MIATCGVGPMRTRIVTWLRPFILPLIILGSLGLVMASAPQTRINEKSCHGLHAGIRVDFVRRYEPFTQPSYVMISFVLLNDDDKPLDTSEASWRLIIDGREVGDSGIVFGNGLGPIGGWKTLNPGATAEFSKGLDADKYFPEPHRYKLSWKGRGFQSPAVEVIVPPSRG
jgi:hypothetical protein